MKKAFMLVAIVAFVTTAGPARSATKIIDYQGFSWETGGFQPSNAGDMMNFVGVADSVDAVFGVDLLTNEVTIWVTNLISTGEIPLGGGFFSISYTGGDLEIYLDPSKDHDYGINPPNATAPSTFVNGSLLLKGGFDSFVLFFDANTGSGAYEGTLTFTGGSALSTVQGIQNDGFTFGGVLNDTAAGGAVPTGYDLQVDGVVEVRVVVSVEQKTWGAVKSMYQSQ